MVGEKAVLSDFLWAVSMAVLTADQWAGWRAVSRDDSTDAQLAGRKADQKAVKSAGCWAAAKAGSTAAVKVDSRDVLKAGSRAALRVV